MATGMLLAYPFAQARTGSSTTPFATILLTVPPSSDAITPLLQNARLELLDLTARNRLLNAPRRTRVSSSLEIVDELSSEIFRLLVRENRKLTFQSASTSVSANPDDPPTALPQPADDEVDERGIAKRHTNTKLQTLLPSEALQKRLLRLFHDAKTYIEEQGVNILYLTLGMLRWYEDAASTIERFAPLFLIPVTLERRTASERFTLHWTGEDPLANLTLAAKLKNDFGIVLPEAAELDDFAIDSYIAELTACLSAQTRWQILPDDMTLGFFSFAKFLMYRDLDPATWPATKALNTHPLICSLLRDGFNDAGLTLSGAEAEQAVRRLAADCFVLDSDSSQSLAIEEVRRGRNLVIQGPPGTGKSQTITNIIADSVRRGKRVLFVAEKMAALEVVKRRLDNLQLGGVCLELHSNKANKRLVLEEIKNTLALGHPLPNGEPEMLSSLEKVRTGLDNHCDRLASPIGSAGRSVFQSVGQLVKLTSDGLAVPGISLPNAQQWTTAELVERESLLFDLAAQITSHGIPANNPWRGVERKALLPIDLDGILNKVQEAQSAFAKSQEAQAQLSAALHCSAPETTAAAGLQLRNATAIANAPELDQASIAHDAWRAISAVNDLVQAGLKWRSEKEHFAPLLQDGAELSNLTATRDVIAKRGGSLLRFLFSDYRASQTRLRTLFRQVPRSGTEQVKMLNRLIEFQAIQGHINAAATLGSSCFGKLWASYDSPWPMLQAIVQWVQTLDKPDADLRALLATLPTVQPVRDCLPTAQQQFQTAQALFEDLFRELSLDTQVAFGQPTLSTVSFAALDSRLAAWLTAREQLSKWIYTSAACRKAQEAGLGTIVEQLSTGQLAPPQALGVFRYAYEATLIRQAAADKPELATFDGDQHSQSLSSFRKLDQSTQSVARFETASAHSNALPRTATSVGALGVLRSEMEKRRRHLPLRQLMKQAGSAIQAIKPVFMMSPLSVAQFLEPGVIEFDLLLIDEASQVQPVDALGAIARSQQIVVVGDDKQLPPTRFFSAFTTDDEGEDADEAGTGARDIESILGLCKARGVPERMLRWHYRSRHQSLIAVSNKEFYANSLFIVPSPWLEGGHLGLHFRFVPNGVFDRGATATNRVEARAVAQAIMQHALTSPERSLGVGTFSIRQKHAILDELELLRRSNPEAEPFFADHPAEPFFVKNLENIQGDERDVIFISVGYAKNADGYMAMNFGPLSSDGGERRLNVLITRAKLQCEVFSSITADDIDLERGRGRGVAALKGFLSFAEKGILDVAQPTQYAADSPFEEEVARALTASGYQVRRQIGIAGFFIDLAVLDSRKPGRYLLGIECDGAPYHSTRSARDRDRLRQAVLESHGWRIYRIWSLDWFQRPAEQLRRAIDAIEAAITTNGEPPAPVPVEIKPVELQRDDATIQAAENTLSVPYVEAQMDTVDLDRPQAAIEKVIEVEGPIHEEEIIVRIRQLSGLARAGSRVQTSVRTALANAVSQNKIVRDGEFYALPSQPVIVRDRSSVTSSSLRKPAMLPPKEVQAAILAIIDSSKGASTPDLATHVPRLFGFAASSSVLRSLVEEQITALERAGILQSQQGRWSRA